MAKVGQNSILPCGLKRSIELCPCFLNSLKSEESSWIAFKTAFGLDMASTEVTVFFDGPAVDAEEVDWVSSVSKNIPLLALALPPTSAMGFGERASTDCECLLLRLPPDSRSTSVGRTKLNFVQP